MKKFKYKNNTYGLKEDGNFVIRSTANLCGYSYFRVTDENMIEILTDYLSKKEEDN